MTAGRQLGISGWMTHSSYPLAEVEAADYAHRAALGADPVGSNPPYELVAAPRCLHVNNEDFCQ